MRSRNTERKNILQRTCNPRGSFFALGRVTRLGLLTLGLAQAVPATAYEMELANCRTPESLTFRSFYSSPNYLQVERIVTYPGETARVILPRNPENNPRHDPGHLQNCTLGSNPNHTQWLVFKFWAENWFGTPNEDHIAIVMRGYFDGLGPNESPYFDGRGMIFHRFWGGVMGERYAAGVPGLSGGFIERLGDGTFDPAFLKNRTTYQVEMHASTNGVAYRVTNLTTGQAAGWRYHGQIPGDLPTFGTGLGFAVLCPPGSDHQCQATSRFTLYLWDIATGWFAP
jgi:hypothetical protein